MRPAVHANTAAALDVDHQAHVVALDLDLWRSCGAAPAPLDATATVYAGIQCGRGGARAAVALVSHGGSAYCFSWPQCSAAHLALFLRGLSRKSTVAAIGLDDAVLPTIRKAAARGHYTQAELQLLSPAAADAGDLLRRLKGKQIRHGFNAALQNAACNAGLVFDNGTAMLVKRRPRGSINPLLALSRACNLALEHSAPQLFFLTGRRDD